MFSTLSPIDSRAVAAGVHLWFAELDRGDASGFLPALSPEERARAERFHFQEDRDLFIVRRGLLRTLLAGYTGIDAARLRIREGKNEKPELAAPGCSQALHFNLSRSGDAALFAFSREHEIGVDLERTRYFPDRDRIIERFFSRTERTAFDRLPRNERRAAFFRYWTAKEAFVKATGEGLSRGLDTFSVAPRSRGCCSPVREGDGPASGWSVSAFTPAAGYAAAVAFVSSCSKRPRTGQGRLRYRAQRLHFATPAPC
jgi:4'-phosphopantetheinyl transferase